MDFETGQRLDWELGGRDILTFRRLYRRIKERFHPNLYCADHWDAYRQVIPEDRLIQSKSATSRVESNNASARHWFARFRRRTRVVSRCQQMVNLTLRLQASWKSLF